MPTTATIRGWGGGDQGQIQVRQMEKEIGQKAVQNVFQPIHNWDLFLESSGNLSGLISVFGDKCLSTEVNFC